MKQFKKKLLLGLCILIAHSLFSQRQHQIDSLVQVAAQSNIDTNLVKTYERISQMYLGLQSKKE